MTPLAWALVASFGVTAMVGLVIAWWHARRSRQLEARAELLDQELTKLQLRSSKGELSPHFLFNTLNLVATLVHEDADKADDILVRLSDMLRATLYGSRGGEVELREELALVESYLAIVRTRFGARLRVETRIDDDCWEVRVPQLVVQLLVENSVRHVLAKELLPIRVAVVARRVGDRLRLEVSDDGPGAPALRTGALAEGIGLSSIRSRLQLLYGGDHLVSFANGPAGGFVVELELPFRKEERPARPGVARRRAVGA